jgi:hypothetical protein
LEVADLVYICDRAYGRTDIVRMEMAILDAVGFAVAAPPSAHTFFGLFLPAAAPAAAATAAAAAAAAAAEELLLVRRVAEYVAQCALLDASLLAYLPSTLAAAALHLARRAARTMRRMEAEEGGHGGSGMARQNGGELLDESWPAALAASTQYAEASILPCARALEDLLLSMELMRCRTDGSDLRVIPWQEGRKVPAPGWGQAREMRALRVKFAHAEHGAVSVRYSAMLVAKSDAACLASAAVRATDAWYRL